MMRRSNLLAGLCLLVLAGCGSGSSGVRDSLVGQLATGVIEARRGAKAPGLPEGGPSIQAKFDNLGLDLRMVPLDRDGDVTIWHDGMGRQLATRNGLLIWTRGFGLDLMSAKVPTPRALRPGSEYERLNVYVDGAGRRYERRYHCTVEVPEEADNGPGRHLRDVCDGPVGKIRNDFWLVGGRIAQSRQWVSAQFGHVEIRH